MSERLIVTGFGPFGSFEENPSERLAKSVDANAPILEVSFKGVDEFLCGLTAADFDALLLMGVAGKTDKIRIESVARNHIGSAPDVRGEIHGPGPIDPRLPGQIAATLWRYPELFEENELWRPSVNAGGYLCNYAFFRACWLFPNSRVGFLHVAPFEQLSVASQKDALCRILSFVA